MHNFNKYIVEKRTGVEWTSSEVEEMTPDLLKNLAFIRNHKSELDQQILDLSRYPEDWTVESINYRFLESGVIFIIADIQHTTTHKKKEVHLKIEKGKMKAFPHKGKNK